MKLERGECKMPIISVIVPVYNVEQYLSQCIDSLLTQTLEDIEIILVDDGSTDACPQICDAYALRDTRIKVIHKVNGGLSDARNWGIERAQGEYIAFLDSDDWVKPDFYEYLYNLIQRKNADIAQCDYIKVYDNTTKIDFDEAIKESTHTGVEALYLLCGEEYIKTVVVWNKLYKRKLFDKIRFPKGKIHEDEFVTYKVLHKASKFVNSNIPMVYYRQRPDSIMAQKFSEKRLHVLEAWKERRDYFKQHNLIELAHRTECELCVTMKAAYVYIQKSDLQNKKEILKQLKKEIKEDYIKYICNPFITIKGKITLTICLLNGQVFYKLYSTHIDKNSRF